MDQRILELIRQVQKPGRYIGEEHNAVKKDWSGSRLRVLLAFPDIYEVGMSYLGMRILYGLLNERDDVLCERAFSPWPDMERLLRDHSVPLFSLESKMPICQFDVIGFSLAYELNYTNVLNMLSLGTVPLRSADRKGGDPVVIAGGPSCYNPEPMADFIDAFVIGDGEEAIVDIVEACKRFLRVRDAFRPDQTPHREKCPDRQLWRDRSGLLRELARIEGLYVPSLYEVDCNDDGTLRAFGPKDGAPARIKKRVVKDLDSAYYPVKQIVPYIQIVHDRIVLEIMRGCTHLCKFCEAGSTCLPRRERSREKIVELAGSVYAHTGYEEISLISLSSGGHSGIKEILRELQTLFKDRAVSISMPSLRIEEITDELPQLIGEVRKTGLTFAPETGSERLRKFIHKDIDIEKLLSAALEAYKAGWDRIKLYFMIGLPTEEEEDLLATAELIRNLSNLRKQFGKGAGYIVASVATFVPKPHTCLQWVGMEPREALEAKQRFLEARSGRTRKVKLDFHDLDTSRLEGVFSRGDRRLGGVIEKAWKMGSRLDSWSEFFRIEVWLQAFRECGLAPEFYVNRARSHEELLPWDFIDVGISKAQLMAFSKS